MSHSALSPVAPRRASTRLLLTLAGAVVLVRWLFMALTGATFEDSYISLRYAENLASGLGLVYNPGERVFGASTPLYVLFLAGLVRLGLPAIWIAKSLAALADGITFYLWARWLLRQGAPLVGLAFFALLFGLGPVMVQVSVSGMETSFALLLLTLALLADLEDRPVACGLWLGALVLVRPDGALAALVILALRWRRTGRLPWAAAFAAGLVAAPWVAAALWYYHSPIPHSILAKAAAYNLHRPTCLPNLFDTLAHFAPTRGPWFRLLTTLVLFPCLLLGLRAAWQTPRLRPLGLLFLAWWAYLVLPKTLLFTWYFPPLLLPAYVLATLGFSTGVQVFRRSGVRGSGFKGQDSVAIDQEPETRDQRPESPTPNTRTPEPLNTLPRWALATLAVGLTGWLIFVCTGTLRLQRAEEKVRREVGLWLQENTPEEARIAMEPIGYIGYYSRRRILDEVGLVSPEMVPLNRAGKGWFGRMLREQRPEFIVERPGYLVRNLTLNSRVPMFASEEEAEAFIRDYRALTSFGTPDVPKHLRNDYRFVVYGRRSPQNAGLWEKLTAHLTREERRDLFFRAVTGPVDLTLRTAKGSGAPPRP